MAVTKVRAIAPGHYGALRAVNDEFMIADDSHIGSWMEPVHPDDASRLAPRLGELRKRIKRPTSIAPNTPATTAQLRDPVVPKAPAPAKPADDADKL